MKALLLPFFFLLLTCTGCTTSKVKLPRDLSFESVLRSSQQGPYKKGLYVIHNADELSQLNINSLPDELRKANFKKGMLIVVAAGEKPTGGHGVEITRIREMDNHIEVLFRESVPANDAFVTDKTTHPYHAVRIGYTDKRVSFSQSSD